MRTRKPIELPIAPDLPILTGGKIFFDIVFLSSALCGVKLVCSPPALCRTSPPSYLYHVAILAPKNKKILFFDKNRWEIFVFKG
jgi:hypothetical protein